MILPSSATGSPVFASLPANCSWPSRSDAVFAGRKGALFLCERVGQTLLLWANTTTASLSPLAPLPSTATFRFLQPFKSHVYYYSDNILVNGSRYINLFQFNEFDQSRTLVWSETIPVRNASSPVIVADSNAINAETLLIVRFSHGPVLLLDGNGTVVQIYNFGYSPPLLTAARRLLFAVGKTVYYPYYALSGAPMVYKSVLPCLAASDCAIYGMSYTCNTTSHFCELSSVPPSGGGNASQPTEAAPNVCPSSVCLSTVTLPSGNTLVVNRTTTIVGNLTITTENATIVLVVVATGSGVAPLQVQGCVTLNGNLSVVIDPSTSLNNSALEVLTFSGYCGGNESRFASINVDLGCREAASITPTYSARSLSLAFGDLSTSKCAQTPTDVGFVWTTPIIAGVATALAVVVIAIVVAVVLMVVFRDKIRPFSSRDSTKTRDTTDHELE